VVAEAVPPATAEAAAAAATEELAAREARAVARGALSETQIRDALRALGVSEAELGVCHDKAELEELLEAVSEVEAESTRAGAAADGAEVSDGVNGDGDATGSAQHARTRVTL
jgi:hypothetical protein